MIEICAALFLKIWKNKIHRKIFDFLMQCLSQILNFLFYLVAKNAQINRPFPTCACKSPRVKAFGEPWWFLFVPVNLTLSGHSRTASHPLRHHPLTTSILYAHTSSDRDAYRFSYTHIRLCTRENLVEKHLPIRDIKTFTKGFPLLHRIKAATGTPSAPLTIPIAFHSPLSSSVNFVSAVRLTHTILPRGRNSISDIEV